MNYTTKESIAKYPKVNDEEIFERLLKDVKPNPNVKEFNIEEFHEVINKVAKEIYEEEKRR